MANRMKGTGSYIHDKKRQRWIFQYYVKDVYGNPRRRAIYAKKRAELEKRVAGMNLGIEDITTLKEWTERWLTLYIKPTVKENTYLFYQYLFKYIPTSLLNMPLLKLKPVSFQKLFTELLVHGNRHEGALSTSTVRSLRSALISCLNAAVNNEILHRNPLLSTKPPKLVRRERVSLTKEQMKRLLKVVDEGNYYIRKADANEGQLYQINEYSVLIHLALASGMRRGEIFGLTWDCVDFADNKIRIIRNLQYTQHHGFSLVAPKTTRSIRTISIDADTMKRLYTFKMYQEGYAAVLGNQFHNRYNLVFTSIFGDCIRFDNFRMRHWKAMCQAAGLPKEFTFHCLRHTMTTLMLQAGVNIKTISARLGHTNSAFTIRVYAHVLDEMETEASNVWSQILQSTKQDKRINKRPYSCGNMNKG